MKKILLYTMMMLMLMVSSAFANVTQDMAGTWQIDTFPVVPDDYDFPHLILVQSYNPNDEEGKKLSDPMISGKADTMKCARFMTTKKTLAQLYVDLLMKEIIKITSNKYIISIGMSVCHDDWYVIYLHDGKDFVSEKIYNTVWEGIKPK